MRGALRAVTESLRPFMDQRSPKSAYRPGGQGPGPFRIKSPAGAALATCTLGSRTTNRARANRTANEQAAYVNCKLTLQGKRAIARERKR